METESTNKSNKYRGHIVLTTLLTIVGSYTFYESVQQSKYQKIWHQAARIADTKYGNNNGVIEPSEYQMIYSKLGFENTSKSARDIPKSKLEQFIENSKTE
jgi:hypothetical protein